MIALLLAVAAAPASAVPGPAADDGARVIRESRVDEREVDLEIASPALGGAAVVRLLLPTRWAERPDRTWPVLYLLHGCCETADYQGWTWFTDVEEFTADQDVLVVMPSGGPAGMYSPWWNFGARGAPDWERFHVTELRQILERGYRAGSSRAVAGVSMGGYGALAYAYRNPGTFGAAASFSGIPNTLFPGAPAVIKGLLVREGYNPYALWGDEVLDHRIWAAHNPFDHVDRLRGVGLYVSAGNGLTGPLDRPGAVDPLEPASLASSKSFTDRLAERGIAVTAHFYASGTHDWPYWQRELRAAWPVLSAALGLEPGKSGA
ncbi:alpha/beta hydrolase family protein [Saccharopolyspora sp. TS4A08]|uniref:Alpha/beta hydrolase family protein n=1 Tax=Saccharopolyspora ipomoeae TaxID=3042027 RepID=A0ABT6PRR4_9PSEU|nr:alpha/beta hydrolase family protein [Saccharopolyspora sp. TS4A08]MDI2030131.1 alpha/beta hydrolase family protein [Saccharopolyspora sp. TS4A08]